MISLIARELPEKVQAWPCYAKALSALAAGAVMVPALPPWGIWPCMFIGLSAFYILLSTVSRARAAFGYGWLFGFGYFAPGLGWIANALLVEGNDFAWVWPLAIAGLPALLALFTATACAITVRIATLTHWSGLLVFVCCLMGAEWLRGWLFTGFPWNLYGYIWFNILPLAQTAAIGGIYWLSLATCLWATLPGFLTIWPQKLWLKALLLAAAILNIGGFYLYGIHRLDAHPTSLRQDIVIRLVQPDIAQEDKWNPAKVSQNLDKLLKLSYARRINNFAHTIIVWPETAINGYTLNDAAARLAIKAMLSSYDGPATLLSGVMRFEDNADESRTYFNSLVAFDKQLNVLAAYDKSHLVPFGEYIPLQKWIPLTPFIKFSGFQAGAGVTTLHLPDGIASFSPLVCYEIIFPGAVADRQNRPDFIVNVTNDAWYGDSAGPPQHFVQAQFRAIEEGLPVIRAANTGISGVIDPVGRVTYKENLFTESGSNVALPQKVKNGTPFTSLKYNLFLITLAALIAIAILSQGYRKIIDDKL